jgi:hypothetical protein
MPFFVSSEISFFTVNMSICFASSPSPSPSSSFQAPPRRLQQARFPRLIMASFSGLHHHPLPFSPAQISSGFALIAICLPFFLVSGLDSSTRFSIPNPSGERLVGILHGSSSADVVVLCHGFRSSKVSFFFMLRIGKNGKAAHFVTVEV